MTANRIGFKILALALVAISVESEVLAAEAVVGQPLPGWQAGELDIHHINTGRGDALLFVMPDGTTMVEDFSGKTVEKAPFSLPTRPDASRPPGEWVARYVQRVLPPRAKAIDYALISHFHGDHMGAIVKDSPVARSGAYKLSGITEFAEHLRISKVIDRGWPSYDYPEPLGDATVANYRKFLAWQIANRRLEVERFEPGRNDQIAMLHDAGRYPSFQIRNLYSNGIVWSGEGRSTRDLFPPLSEIQRDDYPVENALSNAFVVHYGKFDYFSGGDLSSIAMETAFNPPKWKDVELAVAQAAGQVDTMKANHHGSWDANSIPSLAALRPRVIVVTSRGEGHPAVSTWKRLTSLKVWAGERDIFVTNVGPATAETTYNILDDARSPQGHVLIRVAPGGGSYRVFVIDDKDEQMRVKASFGPYMSN